MAHNYILQVTAGTSYDIKTHSVIGVNKPTPTNLTSDLIDTSINVRISQYSGLPPNSPATNPYFCLPAHAKAGDQYSISFTFSLLHESINGEDLVFGNDFDHPIRDRLPPGFGTAFKIVKWVVDPGLEGDFYAERPFLFGGLGGSVNALHIDPSPGSDGERDSVDSEEEETGPIVHEGGSEEGMKLREENGIPETEAGRKKYFLNESNRKAWIWERGTRYGCDFFNPYLDFNDFALRLPGFTLPIMKYWDGQGLRKEQKRSHSLRYTLKNKKTDEVLFVVLFTLYLKEDVDQEGNVKEGVEGGVPFDKRDGEEAEKYEAAAKGEEKKGEEGKEEVVETGDDDVD